MSREDVRNVSAAASPRQRYVRAIRHVEARSEGGSTHVDIRTDPSSDRLIDVKASGGSINVRYANV